MRPISHGQRTAVMILLDAHGTVTPEQQWLLERIIGRDDATLANLVHADWEKLRDRAYPEWRANDWTIRPAFARALLELRRLYAEEVLGQGRLFA